MDTGQVLMEHSPEEGLPLSPSPKSSAVGQWGGAQLAGHVQGANILGFTGRKPSRHRSMLAHLQTHSGRKGRRQGGETAFLWGIGTGGEDPATCITYLKFFIIKKFQIYRIVERMEYITFFNN